MSMTPVSEPQTYEEKLRAERRARQAKWFPKKVVAIPKVVAIVTVPDVVIHLSPAEYQHVLRMREDATAIPITMPIGIKRIVQAVCDFYQISVVDLLSFQWATKSAVVLPRQILSYLCRHTLTSYSLAEIGRHLRRDYSTVSQRHSRIARLRKQDRELNDELNWLEGQLAG